MIRSQESLQVFPSPVGGPGRLHLTARKKWLKQVNMVVMECSYRSNPIDQNGAPLKMYRQRVYREWLQQETFGDGTK